MEDVIKQVFIVKFNEYKNGHDLGKKRVVPNSKSWPIKEVNPS